MSASGYTAAALAAALLVAVPAASAATPERLLRIVEARGAHHWVCREEAGRMAWQLESLDVEILDTDGRPAKRLGDALAWRLADGTRLRGTVQAASEVPRRSDLPWLELQVTGTHGSASRVAQAMRFAYGAGGPGATSCSHGQLGTRVQAPWTGEYYLFAPA